MPQKKGGQRVPFSPAVHKVLKDWLARNLHLPLFSRRDLASISAVTNESTTRLRCWIETARQRLVPRLVEEHPVLSWREVKARRHTQTNCLCGQQCGGPFKENKIHGGGGSSRKSRGRSVSSSDSSSDSISMHLAAIRPSLIPAERVGVESLLELKQLRIHTATRRQRQRTVKRLQKKNARK